MERRSTRSDGFALPAVLALALLGAPACGALPFDVAEDIAEQRVPGDPNPLSVLLPSFLQVPITVSIATETGKRNTGPAHSVVLKELYLEATPHGAAPQTFDFLDALRLDVGTSGGGSTLPVKEIARLDPVPRGQTRIVFDVVRPEVDLLPYVNAGARITSRATGRAPKQDFTFDGRVTLTVRF